MERPIRFASGEIRALLDERKTQVRRIVRPQLKPWGLNNAFLDWGDGEPMTLSQLAEASPYLPGDRLWVQETFVLESNYGLEPADVYRPPHADGRPTHWEESEDYGRVWMQPHYRATDPEPHLVTENQDDLDDTTRWRSSLHMPRWASRITLEIADVRVQRLQEISEEDARAEGLEVYSGDDVDYFGHLNAGHCSAIAAFAKLWDLNSKRAPWSSNPWVWAITFGRVTS
jgi:hypothetical protein